MTEEILDLNKLNPDEIDSELCRRSFYYFVQCFWETIEPSKPIWNWHIKYLCDELEKAGRRLIKEEKKESDIYISMPPGIGKSNLCSILFPAWLWILKPSLKILTASYAKTISANDLSFKAKNVIESDKYRRYFPYVKILLDKSAVSDFHNTAGGSRYSTSVDSGITGKRGDLLMIDDPLNIADIYSEKDRDATNKWVDGLSSRKTNHDYALTVIVQQRLHKEDTIGYLLSQGNNAKYICLPAEYNRSLSPSKLKKFYDEKDGLLFPERLSRETLDQERKKSLSLYNAQFLQSPSDFSDSLIQEKSFPVILAQDFFNLANRAKPTIDFFIDSANTGNTKRDPQIIMAACRIDNDIYITNISRVWVEVPQMIQHIKAFVPVNGYDARSRIWIEPQSSGLSILQMLKQGTTLNALAAPHNNKFNKEERLMMITPTIDTGRVKLVKGKWNAEFLEEVCNPQSSHDDIKDALCMAVQQLLSKRQGSGKYNYSFTH